MDKAILLVEDNKGIQLANKDMLELLGYKVILAMSLAEARGILKSEMPDVIVLDILLPDGSGLDFLGELRAFSHVPVLMLSALDSVDDTVAGFTGGADDYLAKPYEYKVLSARIEALLRRAEQMPKILQKGSLTLDILARRAFLHEEDLLLTQKDFMMLLVFIQNESRIISGEFLYEKIWKADLHYNAFALKNAVSRLRKKLGETEYTISAIRGKGYLFERG